MDEQEANNYSRVKLSNLPIANFQNVKKFLKSKLAGLPIRKLKHSGGGQAYFTLASAEEAEKAVGLLDKATFKRQQIRAKLVENEPKTTGNAGREAQNVQAANDAIEGPKCAKDLVTPLADLPYEEQLEKKFADSRNLLNSLRKQMSLSNVQHVPKEHLVLHKVLASPITRGYRNKCEFAIGYSGPDGGDIVVGFVSGKMANRQVRVLPICTDHDDAAGEEEYCPNLSANTLAIVRQFQQFVRQFDDLQPFDEFQREGFWKMLTVKDFLADCLLICTVHPQPERPEVSARVKCALVDCFLPSKGPVECPPVISIYWQEQANASDERCYQHVAGPPFVYASLLGMRFRISPSTFFQTNSRAAAVLYTKIGDLLGLPSSSTQQLAVLNEDDPVIDGSSLPSEAVDEQKMDGKEEEAEENGPSREKRQKLEEDGVEGGKEENAPNCSPPSSSSSTLLLDICCGAGSIGLCLMSRLRKAAKSGGTNQFGCIGVELNVEAVRDAKRNAIENGFGGKSVVFIDGQAENIFHDLGYHMPTGCSLSSSQVLGVIDPPRAGVSDRVVIGCRKLESLKTLVYVACDPQSATKNLVDLCRPMSRKFEGEPFQVVTIQPVDMFPHTQHFEWVVKLQRS